MSFLCPKCDGAMKCLLSRRVVFSGEKTVRRRHECKACGRRISTVEVAMPEGSAGRLLRQSNGDGLTTKEHLDLDRICRQVGTMRAGAKSRSDLRNNRS